jgi:hypothetical protein
MERSAGVCQPDAGSSSRDASNLWGTFRAKKEAGRRVVDLPIPGFSRREVRISAAPKLARLRASRIGAIVPTHSERTRP